MDFSACRTGSIVEWVVERCRVRAAELSLVSVLDLGALESKSLAKERFADQGEMVQRASAAIEPDCRRCCPRRFVPVDYRDRAVDSK